MKKKRQLTDRGAGMQLSNDPFEFNPNLWEKQEVVRLLKGAPGTQYQEANDIEKTVIRDWVRSLLQNGKVTVTFVKSDGSVRDMLCTLDHSLIPPRSVVPQRADSVDGIVRESRKPRKEPDPHSLRVFDLEKQEWRSFRFDRLQKVTATLDFQ